MNDPLLQFKVTVQSSFKWVIVWMFLLSCVPRTISAVQTEFVADAEITTTVFKRDGSVFMQTKADGAFTYSNGWWEAVAHVGIGDEPNSPLGAPQAHADYCMRIPDGVRHYTLFKGVSNGLPAAVACPISFPPPGKFPLFAIWLSFCPNPELPLISSNQMHRFISLPSCEKEILNHPHNIGDFTIRYLDSPDGFLASLSISNNGTYIDMRMGGGVDESKVPEPFQNGFLDFSYAVIETTNINGLLFPLRTELRRYAIGRSSQSEAPGIYNVSLVEVAVKTITLTASNASRATPPVLFAFDSRPPQLPDRKQIRYSVTNDHWQPLTNHQISNLVTSVIYSGNGPRNLADNGKRKILRTVLFLGSFTFLVLFIAMAWNQKKKLTGHQSEN